MPNPAPGDQHDDYGSPLASVVTSTNATYPAQPNPLITSDNSQTISYHSPTPSFEAAKSSDNLPRESYDTPQPAHNPPPNPAGQPSNDFAEPEYNAPAARPAYHPRPADASYNEVESDEYGTPVAPVIPLLSLEKGIIPPDDNSNAFEQRVPLAPVDNLKYANTASGETVEDSFEYWESPGGEASPNPLPPALASFAPPPPQPTLRELPPPNLLYNPISVADPTTPQPSPTAKTAPPTSTSRPSYSSTVKEIVPESSYSQGPDPTPPAYAQPSTTTTATQASVSTSSSETLAPIVYSYSTPAPETEMEETFKRQTSAYIPGSSVGPYIGAAPVFSQGPRVPDIWEMFNAEWGQRVRRRSG